MPFCSSSGSCSPPRIPSRLCFCVCESNLIPTLAPFYILHTRLTKLSASCLLLDLLFPCGFPLQYVRQLAVPTRALILFRAESVRTGCCWLSLFFLVVAKISLALIRMMMLVLFLVGLGLLGAVSAWTMTQPPHFSFQSSSRIHSVMDARRTTSLTLLRAVPGADIEQPPVEEDGARSSSSSGISTTAAAAPTTIASTTEPASRSDIPTTTTQSSMMRGKVNEIDFCIAPADVSLSRAYGKLDGAAASSSSSTNDNVGVGLSLTRALNNASNRAVRRILLARSWPSAEALNESLRQVAALEAAREKELAAAAANGSGGAKCPVPRPILNVLTRNRQQQPSSSSNSKEDEDGAPSSESNSSSQQQLQAPPQKRPQPRGPRTDEEYVADQLQSFRERYGTLAGYEYAQDYLECVLSLATSGVESPRARDVLAGGIYDEAYKRVLSVLRSVGVAFERDPAGSGRPRIASKLKDQDICWSMLDKIQMRQQLQQALQQASSSSALSEPQHGETVAPANDKTDGEEKDDDGNNDSEASVEVEVEESITAPNEKKKKGIKFWKRNDDAAPSQNSVTRDDLGGVLLSAEEPTVTRQLNVLSNIVQRALLFGGDQELLVLAETLDADRAAFIQRWYPGTRTTTDSNDDTAVAAAAADEKRPGLEYFDCLIKLLRECYEKGVVTDLNPPLKLTASYANAYERLVASSVELGSGYLKPTFGSSGMASPASSLSSSDGSGGFSSIPKPRTAQEELGRFAVWETKFRQSAASASSSSSSSSTAKFSPYPLDLVGSWEVRDEIGGETIGSCEVTFLESGSVQVAPPLEGLRWRLDPGPTHLDTCTFQVLSTLDGTVLQYRGFIDRGARLEARFSRRPTKIRGSVMFQMRDGVASVDYYKDILPINYRTGTTKFVMTKKVSSE